MNYEFEFSATLSIKLSLHEDSTLTVTAGSNSLTLSSEDVRVIYDAITFGCSTKSETVQCNVSLCQRKKYLEISTNEGSISILFNPAWYPAIKEMNKIIRIRQLQNKNALRSEILLWTKTRYILDIYKNESLTKDEKEKLFKSVENNPSFDRHIFEPNYEIICRFFHCVGSVDEVRIIEEEKPPGPDYPCCWQPKTLIDNKILLKVYESFCKPLPVQSLL